MMAQAGGRQCPVLAWLVAGLLVAPMLVIAAWWHVTPGAVPDLPVEQRMKLALRSWAARDGAGPAGVALSMSTNQCALRGPEPLVEGGVRLLPLYFPGAAFDDFADLVLGIVAARPAVVVIEEGLLWRRYTISDSLKQFRVALVLGARANLLGQTAVLDRYVSIPAPCCAAGIAPVHQTSEGSGLPFIDPAQWDHAPEVRRLRDGLAAMAAAGIRIVIAARPVMAGTSGAAAGRPDRTRAALARLLPGVDVPVLVPEPYPATDFCDPLHIGAPGQARYSAWLNTQIAGLLGRPS